MTNAQAQGYAIIALKNLIDAGTIKTNNKNIFRALDHELYGIFNMVGEEEAELIAEQILQDM